jgi:hypothetical protein
VASAWRALAASRAATRGLRVLDRALPFVALAALVVVILAGIVPPKRIPWFPMTLVCVCLGGLGLLGAARYARGDGRVWHRSAATWILFALLAAFLGTMLSQPRRLTGDGPALYAYLRSAWIDHDLDTMNDLAILNPKRTRNVHPVGPAILWSPFYGAADALTRLYGEAPDGKNRFYQNAVALGGLLWGWLGLVILERTLRAQVRAGPALLATLGIGLGTFLAWYIAFEPTMAHGPAFTMTTLFLHLWLKPTAGGWRRGALLGAVLGLVALARPANGLVGLLLLSDGVALLSERRLGRLIREAVACAGAFLVVFSPQMITWRILWGGFLVVPQGRGFLASAPAYDGVLFSPDRGLFSWSPILYLGLAGLLLLLRRDRIRLLAVLLFIAALTRLNAGVRDWSGSTAFGARRFDATLPFFAWGLALLLEWGRRLVRRHPLLPVGTVVAAFIVWNVFVIRAYESGAWGSANPVAFEQMGFAVVSGIDATAGPVVSLPGAIMWSLRTGRPHTLYGRQYVTGRFTRAQTVAGSEDRFTFWRRWSVPGTHAGETCRFSRGAYGVIVFGLHGVGEHVFGARIAVPEATERPAGVTVIVNRRPLGRWKVGPDWQNLSLTVPADVVRNGRNEVDLIGGPSRVAVANVWIAPRQSGPAQGAVSDTSR